MSKRHLNQRNVHESTKHKTVRKFGNLTNRISRSVKHKVKPKTITEFTPIHQRGKKSHPPRKTSRRNKTRIVLLGILVLDYSDSNENVKEVEKTVFMVKEAKFTS